MTFIEVDISNGTNANVVLRVLDLHFQGQTFSYALIQKLCRQQISPADLPRLARLSPWSCSCHYHDKSVIL